MTETPGALLQLCDLCKSYETTDAVSGVSLAIARGERGRGDAEGDRQEQGETSDSHRS